MPKGVYPRRPRQLPHISERFWPKVHKTDGCWEWTAYKSPTGYGVIGLTRRGTNRVHRVSWELAFGPIPDGLEVLHRCDNRACVRPDHLFLGTQLDNIRDMENKGRRRSLVGDDHPARRPDARVGERNGRARLDAEAVRQIRRLRHDGMEYREIAAMFGVAVPTVQHVVSGRNWSHIRD